MTNYSHIPEDTNMTMKEMESLWGDDSPDCDEEEREEE